MKRYAALLSILLFLGACSAAKTTTQDPSTNTSDQTGQTLKAFTLAELVTYNGRNGAKAYVAYKGKVYDVTDFGSWDTGSHHGIKAGTDITSAFANSPHSTSMFSSIPIVGTLSN